MDRNVTRFLLLMLALSATTFGWAQSLHSSQNPQQTVSQGGEGLRSSTHPEGWVNGASVQREDSLDAAARSLKAPQLAGVEAEPTTGAGEVADSSQWVLLETGTASYYTSRLHGHMMASGARYDKYALFCAHKTLPFGTNIRVVNKKNGKDVIVPVKDRGPYVRGRVVDVSNTAADVLGMTLSGIVPVELWIEREVHEKVRK